MRISALEGRATAVWGYGREGRAALQALRAALPGQRFALICSAGEAEEARGSFGDAIDLHSGEPSLALLRGFEWIVKSPGISPYRGLAAEALAAGVRFTSGTALWFGEHAVRDPQVPVLCLTGSKGKSTTTALIAHLLRASGRCVALAGNIGLPLLELLDQPAPEVYVFELSSYQTRDAQAPAVAVLLNLYPEHLDWHGSEARYYDDKCALVESVGARRVLLNAESAPVRARLQHREDALWFGQPKGWHLSDDGWICRADARVFEARELPLPGAHNARNLCAALAAIEALGIDALPLATHARSFRALPHRLQAMGVRDGLLYANDSISTTPHASLAALAHYRGRPVAILVGGHDRGLDWSDFVEAVRTEPPQAIVCTGSNGPRIATALRAAGLPAERVLEAARLPEALAAAQAALRGALVSAESLPIVLLSPGAPSFGEFRDYAERGREFARLSGFDAKALGMIEGLGVA
ncbi:MAG: UDP-N-acetylmuramoyl-L-alanine--D-glutamate ligase [Aquimonas sp.]|nr:UDP-N-acetylmuramoyl-L-alanine--D-glutamate ligase [Aquimonas sp.]